MKLKYIEKNKAFTLIDILISVAIVSILSSVILFNVTEGKNKAEDAHMKIESGQVATALELYQSDNNGFMPLKVTTLNYDGTIYKEDSSEYEAAMQYLVTKGYISEIPRSPSGAAYFYGESTDHKSALFIISTNRSGNICLISGGSNFGQTGKNNSCEGIVIPEENPEEYPEEDPYTVVVGYYDSIELEPNQTYTLIYSGNGSEMFFVVDGQSVIQTWISGDSLAMTSITNDWQCNNDCYGPNGDSLYFESYNQETLTLKIIYYSGY